MRLVKAFLSPLSLSLAIATVASFSLPKAAQAALFNFSYTSSVGVLTGTLDGTLQSDNDTVFVTAVPKALFNGVPGPALPFLSSVTTFSGGSLVPPKVTLSGLNLDFIAAISSSISGNDGFTFIPAGIANTFASFTSGPSFGNAIFDPYNPTNWSLTPVPEPSAVVALALVGGGLLLSKRRKAD
jgi:hypothetical protein